MMLTWLNKQGVISDEGWSFQRMDRFHCQYAEYEHRLDICVESGEVFLSGSLQWQPPLHGEPISLGQREMIRKRIVEAIEFMGTKYKVVDN